MFSGAVVVYLAIAACGASSGGGLGSTLADDGGGEAASSSSSGAGGSSASSAGGGGSLLDAIADALANPVQDAIAGPLPPIVATENCDKTFTYGNNVSTTTVAVHAFPGKLVNDLAAVRVVLNSASAGYTGSVGGQSYTHFMGAFSIFLADGSVAVACSPADTVTFTLPQ